MNHIQAMHMLHALKKLVEEHEGGLEGELCTAKIEQVLDTRPQEICYHIDKLVFHRDALINKSWEALTLQVFELGDLLEYVSTVPVHALRLDRHRFLIFLHVLGEVYFPEGTFPYAFN